jgi:hypothetical protein
MAGRNPADEIGGRKMGATQARWSGGREKILTLKGIPWKKAEPSLADRGSVRKGRLFGVLLRWVGDNKNGARGGDDKNVATLVSTCVGKRTATCGPPKNGVPSFCAARCRRFINRYKYAQIDLDSGWISCLGIGLFPPFAKGAGWIFSAPTPPFPILPRPPAKVEIVIQNFMEW